jgi:hypothetical protein
MLDIYFCFVVACVLALFAYCVHNILFLLLDIYKSFKDYRHQKISEIRRKELKAIFLTTYNEWNHRCAEDKLSLSYSRQNQKWRL